MDSLLCDVFDTPSQLIAFLYRQDSFSPQQPNAPGSSGPFLLPPLGSSVAPRFVAPSDRAAGGRAGLPPSKPARFSPVPPQPRTCTRSAWRSAKAPSQLLRDFPNSLTRSEGSARAWGTRARPCQSTARQVASAGTSCRDSPRLYSRCLGSVAVILLKGNGFTRCHCGTAATETVPGQSYGT